MTEKRKVLGRGLETLLPPRQVPHAPTTVAAAASTPAPSDRPGEALHQIPLDHLDRNPYQTRTMSFDPAALNELAASIQAVGMLQPIVVRPVPGGRYQVIAGERRCEAARMLHHQPIPAVVRPVSNQQAMEMTIVENLQRLDLTPMEEARGYDRLSRELGLTQEQMVTNLVHPPEKAEKVRIVDPNVKEAEQELQRALGVRVAITDRNGKGKILIEYSSLEDFDRI